MLVDFWTYSCINCLRTLPHLEAWDARYRKRGLVIVGVHTPEFAFEHVLGERPRAPSQRSASAIRSRSTTTTATWNAYANQYWPAEYLIDRSGHVRHAHFGEGEYGDDRAGDPDAARRAGASVSAATTRLADATPTGLITPETYLGYQPARRRYYRVDGSRRGQRAATRFAEVAAAERARVRRPLARGRGAHRRRERRALRLHFHAQNVYLVLGGQGRVRVLVDGRPARLARRVDGYRLYTASTAPEIADGVLELRFTPGIRGYAFTFG